jgi:hypothetical protein
MSIESFIKKVCVQTAVYWGNPVSDGYGGKTFDAAVEIKCRWEEKLELFTSSNGEQLVSRAVILLTQDVDDGGFLYLGELDTLVSPIDVTKPKTITGAWEIKRFDKIPMIKSTTVFVRKAYL